MEGGLEDKIKRRNKCLRTLETTARSITAAGDTASVSLGTVLSSITSPALLDVVVVYRYSEFEGTHIYTHSLFYEGGFCSHHPDCPVEMAAGARRHQDRFKIFREMHEAREFRLMFCVDILDPVVRDATEMLERIVRVEKTEGGFDYLLHEPLIIVEMRTSGSRRLGIYDAL